ncbi:MAG: metallophosphoesterase, partial [Myxococcota bacterium]|nr:metallophosphoesterase [Myxococcota bacterium]
DGQNSGSYGQGLSFSEPQSKPALRRVMDILDRCHFPIYHSIGNHELYNFTIEELKEVLSSKDRKHRVAEENLYYQFRPSPGWVGIMLNPYEVSVTLPKESLGHQKAVALLRQYNDNYLSQGKVDYFRGLSGLNQRFVPFNGGLGEKQLLWLSLRIQEAVAAGERILVFSHIPLCPDAASARNIAYDYDRVLEILETEGKGNVKAVFAGHYHRGGYAKDKAGIHHLTLRAILTHNDSFGHVDVYMDRLEFVGRGGHGSKNLSFA